MTKVFAVLFFLCSWFFYTGGLEMWGEGRYGWSVVLFVLGITSSFLTVGSWGSRDR